MRTHRLLVPALALSVPLSAGLSLGATAHAATGRQLDRTVRSALAGSTASHADYVVRVAGVSTLRRGGDVATAPASTNKLLTTATLLSEVGPSFTYRTAVDATGPVVGHTLDGDLALKASGDPTLTSHDLTLLASRVHRAGITHVTGRLVVDDFRYTHTTIAHGWKRSFVPEETGPVDAFTVDRNTWRSGTAYDADPTAGNAARWRSILRKQHVTVAGAVHVARAPVGATTLATHRSGPLSEIVDQTLTNSDNFDAEMMLREAGARRSGTGSLSTGVAAVRAQAARFGVTLGKVYDGSGLSYSDRESPATFVAWLAAVRRSTYYDTVYAALPVSCRTGTLEHRLCGAHLTGRVHAKTGTLDGVRALAGWTTTRSGQLVTFAFQLSGIRDMTRAGNRLDAAVAAVARSS